MEEAVLKVEAGKYLQLDKRYMVEVRVSSGQRVTTFQQTFVPVENNINQDIK